MLSTYQIFVVHFGACLFMTGVIWIIQVVHYPLFAQVGTVGYADYQAAHMRLITYVVMPAMLLELGTAVLLVWSGGAFAKPDLGWFGASGFLWLNLAGVLLIWGSTALLQVPAHQALLQNFEVSAHNKLVSTNWIRTIVWSVRALALGYLAARL